MKNNPYLRRWASVSVLLVAAVIALVAYLDFSHIPFYEIRVTDETLNFWSFLGGIFLVTLLAERFVELFVRDTHEEEKEELKADIARLQAAMNPAGDVPGTSEVMAVFGAESPADLHTLLRKKEERLYRLRKQREYSILLTLFVIGLLISLSGFSLLSHVFDTSQLSTVQHILFRSIDLVFSAALISSGSGGMHELVKVVAGFKDFLLQMPK